MGSASAFSLRGCQRGVRIRCGAAHAYGFVYPADYAGQGGSASFSAFPVTTFDPPTQPRAERGFQFGRALGRAIATWAEDIKVRVVHRVDSAISLSMRSSIKQVLSAMQKGDSHGGPIESSRKGCS